MRTTLADVKASRIPDAIGLCVTDSRFLSTVNEAQQRLLTKGHWFGTYAKYKICATQGCITLPPQLATIETVAISGIPIPVHDLWYEFLENGWGTRNDSCSSTSSNGTCGIPEANYRGQFPTFSDVRGTTKKLLFVCDLASDVGKTVLALGYDENNNWIRTNQGGTIKDGELITLAQSPGTQSTNKFTWLKDLQFPTARDGQVWLYSLDTITAAQVMLGHYQYWETHPSYARYLFPSLVNACGANGNCRSCVVELIGKLQYIPAINDTDYMIIGNIPALKAMCVGIRQSEKEPDVTKKAAIMAAAYAEALGELDSELDHQLGSGRRIGMNVVGSSVGQVMPIENFL